MVKKKNSQKEVTRMSYSQEELNNSTTISESSHMSSSLHTIDEVYGLLNSLKITNGEFTKTIQFLSDMYDNQKNLLEDISNKMKQYIKENEELKIEVKELKSRINDLEEKDKEKNLLISGIELTGTENLKTDIIDKITKALNVEIEKNEIETCYQIRKNNKNSPIILKLLNKSKKEEIIKRRKENGPLFIEECGIISKNGIIYINEDLSKEKQKIFKEARELRKQKKIAFTWITGGKIYIRKTADGPAVRLRDIQDLNRYT